MAVLTGIRHHHDGAAQAARPTGRSAARIWERPGIRGHGALWTEIAAAGAFVALIVLPVLVASMLTQAGGTLPVPVP